MSHWFYLQTMFCKSFEMFWEAGTWHFLNFLKRKGKTIALTKPSFCNIHVCLFQGWDGYRRLPRFPPLPDGRVRICRNPQSREFPPLHYSGLGTRIRKWNIIGSYSFFMFPHPPPEICYSFTEYKILKYALLTFKLHRLNSDSNNTYRYIHIGLTYI